MNDVKDKSELQALLSRITKIVQGLEKSPITEFTFLLKNFQDESPVSVKDFYMLHIEYIHKRARLFRVELSFRILAVLIVLMLIWQILSVLRFFK